MPAKSHISQQSAFVAELAATISLLQFLPAAKLQPQPSGIIPVVHCWYALLVLLLLCMALPQMLQMHMLWPSTLLLMTLLCPTQQLPLSGHPCVKTCQCAQLPMLAVPPCLTIAQTFAIHAPSACHLPTTSPFPFNNAQVSRLPPYHAVLTAVAACTLPATALPPAAPPHPYPNLCRSCTVTFHCKSHSTSWPPLIANASIPL